jgi:hypothetical protein
MVNVQKQQQQQQQLHVLDLHSTAHQHECSYSNLENHPNLLREKPGVARIRIGKKVYRPRSAISLPLTAFPGYANCSGC